MSHAPNELAAIAKCAVECAHDGQRAALCSVVAASGSTYRRVGARMLVRESGELVGAISAGCVDGDVIERARAVMRTREPICVRYDASSDADVVWGFGLGCRGAIQILIDSIDPGSAAAEELAFLRDMLEQRRPFVIATVIDGRKFGARWFVEPGLDPDLCRSDDELVSRIREDAARCAREQLSGRRTYASRAGNSSVLFEYFAPQPSLIIFGSAPDVLPLLQLAKSFGLHVTVVDPRALERSHACFAEADEVVLCRPAQVARAVRLDPNSAVVLMTHHYLLDCELLNVLLRTPLAYLGVMGPQRRTQSLLDDLRRMDPQFAFDFAHLHAPIGIDIGADAPAEIALAVLAEIKAVLNQRSGAPLRDHPGTIHD